MKSIKKTIYNEITINKSKFITYIYNVDDEEQVKEILKNIKIEYKDATHYCYSYIIDNVKRFNDDGEPSGTAGVPILNVLENNNLNHVLAIVVRYFGGIKLGAGGLVRAYSKSISESLLKGEICNLKKGINILVRFSYENLKLVDNVLKDISIEKKDFQEEITYSLNIDFEQLKYISEKLKDIILIEKKESVFIKE